MKSSSLADVRLVRRLLERLIDVYVGGSGNDKTSCCDAGLRTAPAAVAAAAWLIANASPRGQCHCCMSRVVLSLWKVRLHVALNVPQILSGTVDKEWSSSLGGKPTVPHSVTPACCKMLHVDSQ